MRQGDLNVGKWPDYCAAATKFIPSASLRMVIPLVTEIIFRYSAKLTGLSEREPFRKLGLFVTDLLVAVEGITWTGVSQLMRLQDQLLVIKLTLLACNRCNFARVESFPKQRTLSMLSSILWRKMFLYLTFYARKLMTKVSRVVAICIAESFVAIKDSFPVFVPRS